MPFLPDWDRARGEDAAIRLAMRDIRAIINDVGVGDPMALRAAILALWPDIITRYGEITAMLAAEYFEASTGLDAFLDSSVDLTAAQARARWATAPLRTGEGDWLGRLEVLMDELIKQPGRDTMITSATRHGLRFARVPNGDTCPFCLMLASRGAVYLSEKSAGGDGRRFHGKCDCTVEPIRDDEDMEVLKRETGYDPDELYDQYLAARERADSRDTHAILAQLRESMTTTH